MLSTYFTTDIMELELSASICDWDSAWLPLVSWLSNCDCDWLSRGILNSDWLSVVTCDWLSGEGRDCDWLSLVDVCGVRSCNGLLFRALACSVSSPWLSPSNNSGCSSWSRKHTKSSAKWKYLQNQLLFCIYHICHAPCSARYGIHNFEVIIPYCRRDDFH